MDFADGVGHFSGDDGFIMIGGCFPNGFLFEVEVSFFPGSIFGDSAGNSFILLEIEERAIDFHDVFGESGFGEEGVGDEFLSGFEELSVSDVFLPDAEDFGECVRLKEADVGDDVEKSGLMHPVGEADNFCGGDVLLPFGLELFFHFLGEDLNNTVGRNCVVLIKDHFLLVFIGGDDFEIVWPELVGIDFLDAVDELYGSGVAVFGEKRDCGFSSPYCFQDVAHGLIYEKCILNLVLVFFGFLLVQSLGDGCVIGGVGVVSLLLVVVFVVLVFAFFVFFLVAADF